jgi:DNA-directed RNA polymerase subunit RPC12/RpoP
MEKCPRCGSENVRRSRARSLWERWRKEITRKRPYRCPDCDWRGWRVDAGPTFTLDERIAARKAVSPEPPNLKGTALAREEALRVDIDLDALDRAGDEGADFARRDGVDGRDAVDRRADRDK